MNPAWNKSGEKSKDPADRLLESALEERFSAEHAPDLRHRILSASPGARREAVRNVDLAAGRAPLRRSSRLPAAALLLFGFGLLWLVLQLRNAGGENAPDVAGEIRLLRPTDVAEFSRLLANVDRISIRSLVSQEKSVDLSSGPGGMIEIETAGQVTELKKAMLASTEAHPVAGWNWLHRINLHLADGQVMHASLYMFGEQRWAVDGLGDLRASAGLNERLRPLIAAAEFDARSRQGIIFGGDELRNEGDFPSDLSKLVCFDLVDEDLPSLARFARLTSLDLSGSAANLSSEALAAGPLLADLRELRFRQGMVSNSVLESLAKLSRLEILDLSGTAWLPSNLGKKPAGTAKLSAQELAKLKEQTTKEPPGGGFAAFVPGGRLRELDLSYSDLRSDQALGALSRFANLQRLNLRGRESGWFTAEGLRSLGRSSSIEDLDLRDLTCDLDAALAHWQSFDSLRVLQLGASKIGSVGVENLPAGLLELDLTRCRQLSDAGVLAVARLKHLQSLSLQDTGVSAKSLAALAGLSDLRRLNLRGLKLSGEAGLWLSRLQNLQSLDLGFTATDDRMLLTLSQVPSLQELILVACDDFGDVGLAALGSASSLRLLNLKLCDGFTAEGLAAFAKLLPDCQLLR